MNFINKSLLPMAALIGCHGAFAYDLPIRNTGLRPVSGLTLTDNLGHTASMDLPGDSQRHALRMSDDAVPVDMLEFTLTYCPQGQPEQSCALPGDLKMSRIKWYAGCTVDVGLQAIPVGAEPQQRLRDALITGMGCP